MSAVALFFNPSAVIFLQFLLLCSMLFTPTVPACMCWEGGLLVMEVDTGMNGSDSDSARE